MRLTDKACKATPISKLQKRSDGGGLQLWVHPNGSRLWRLAYRFDGKQKLLALGIFPDVSLADARELRDAARKILAKGTDPSEARKQERAAKNDVVTFQALIDEYIAKLIREGRRPATLTKVEWLLGFAKPELGKRDAKLIRAPDILPVLQAVEQRGRLESARRLRETIGSVFRLGMAQGKVDTDPTIALRGALARVQHTARPAITEPKAFGALLRAIDGFTGQPTTAAALRLIALLFPRPGELRGAEWSEFDLDSAVWNIPAQRMKAKRAHRSPLSRQAIAILKDLQLITGSGRLVFPSVRAVSKPISEMTMNAALRRLGYGKNEATAHGFRASASTLLNESGLWNSDAIERQLAHLDADEVRRAYARGEHWRERTNMMQWWADELDRLRKSGPGLPLWLDQSNERPRDEVSARR